MQLIYVNNSRTYTVACAPAVTGSVFQRRFQLFLGQCGIVDHVLMIVNYFQATFHCFLHKLAAPSRVTSNQFVLCIVDIKEYIQSQNGQQSPIVFKNVHSPNLSPPALQYTALPVFLAGGERLGEWTFQKTMEDCCPFYE